MSSWSQLRQFTNKLLGRTTKQQTTEYPLTSREVIESGDFKLDVAHRTASIDGIAFKLTPEDFEVLMFVVNHPQRLITPHTVLATSWARSERRQTEFLRVLISLRKKLEEAAPGKHYLRTEPWVVYRFSTASSPAM